MFTSLKRVICSGFGNFRKQGGLTTATLFIMAITILLISSLFLFQGLTKFLIYNIQERVDILVYFEENTSESDILEAGEKISQLPEVKEIEYISKDDALRAFNERHEDDPILIESLEVIGLNPFLASLEIRAFESSQYAGIANFLEEAPFKDLIVKIDYLQKKPVIEKLASLSSAINKGGIAFSLIFVIIAILIAFNTIRMAIYHSREEIKVMKLVGAANWFIRTPFLVQGIVVGILAVLISLLILAPGLFFLSPELETLIPGFNIFDYFINNFWILLSIQLATGIGLGAISSAIAIRKYLKV